MTVFTGATVPFRFVDVAQITSIRIGFTSIPDDQKIYRSYGFEDEISGIAVEPITDRFPNLGTIRFLNGNLDIYALSYKLEYANNVVSLTHIYVAGFELWIRPGTVCDVITYY